MFKVRTMAVAKHDSNFEPTIIIINNRTTITVSDGNDRREGRIAERVTLW